MGNEFSSDIAGHGTKCSGPPCTLEVKAGASAEFRNLENSQTSDSPGKNALGNFSHLCLSFIMRFPLTTTACGEGEYGGAMFLRDVTTRLGE